MVREHLSSQTERGWLRLVLGPRSPSKCRYAVRLPVLQESVQTPDRAEAGKGSTVGWFRSLLALEVAGMPRRMRMEYPGAIYQIGVRTKVFHLHDCAATGEETGENGQLVRMSCF